MHCWQLSSNQHLIVKYEPMSANAICSTLVGGVLIVPLCTGNGECCPRKLLCTTETYPSAQQVQRLLGSLFVLRALDVFEKQAKSKLVRGFAWDPRVTQLA